MQPNEKVPVIDIFAGAGGLGEGFSNYRPERERGSPFEIQLSVEKDPAAINTLTLRKIFHYLRDNDLSTDPYYEFLRGNLGSSVEEFFEKTDSPGEFASVTDALASAQLRTCQLELKPSRRNDGLEKIVRRATGGRKDWVLIGGPPCQAYSQAGRSRKAEYKLGEDAKHWLYKAYLGILARCQPAVFVFENVPGLLSSSYEQGRIFDRILRDLRRPGRKEDASYELFSLTTERSQHADDGARAQDKTFIVQSELYGIPQKRHRVIIVGVRKDMRISRIPLLRTAPCAFTVADAIGNCPRIRSGLTGTADDTALNWVQTLKGIKDQPWFSASEDPLRRSIRSGMSKVAGPRQDRGGQYLKSAASHANKSLRGWFHDKFMDGGLTQHHSRAHMPSDLHRYFFAACYAKVYRRSPKISELPSSLRPNHRSADGDLNSAPFKDRFRVQLASEPATTITSHIAKDGHYYIHYDPTQCRSLTVREAARLQTFKDNFFFCGSRGDQYRQIGNAVPSLLALQIAEIVYGVLNSASRK